MADMLDEEHEEEQMGMGGEVQVKADEGVDGVVGTGGLSGGLSGGLNIGSRVGQSYEDWLRQRQGQSASAAQLVMDSVKDDPEKIAGVLNTAKAFGALSGIVPTFEMAKRFQSDFEREIIKRHNQKILEESPKLSLWLRNPEFAGVAKDDVENLSWFAGLFNSAVTGAARLGGVWSQASFEAAAKHARDGVKLDPMGIGLLQEWDAQRQGRAAFDPEFKATTSQELEELGRAWWREEAVEWGGYVEWFGKAREHFLKSGRAQRFENTAMKGGGGDFFETLSNFGEGFGNSPLGALAWAIETAGESWPQLTASVAAGSAGGIWGAIGASGLGTYLTERFLEPADFFHKKGFDLSNPEDVEKIINDPALMREAAERGHIRGLVIGAFDALSVGVAGKVLHKKNPYVEAVAQSVSQMFLGGGGEAAATLAVGDKLDWNEVFAEAFAELATTPVDMIAAGRKMRVMDRAADAAKIVKDQLKAISDKAGQSKLRQRMPDKFKDYTADVLKGSPVETLYVDAGKLNEYFQSQGLEAKSIVDLLDEVELEDYQRALASGGDIAIPTSTYAAKIAGSDLDSWLQDNARLEPEGMSAAEAADYEARIEGQFQELAEEAAKERTAQEALIEGERGIQIEMEERLKAAGRADDVAAYEAMPIAAFYRTMSERAGISLDEMVKRYPLPEVRGDLPTGVKDKQVDGLSRYLAFVRNWRPKERVKKGRSLLEFIDSIGGINDPGGELRHMGAAVVKRGRGKKTLRLERSDSKYSMFGGVSDGSTNSIDDVAYQAIEAGYFADNPIVYEYLTTKGERPDLVPLLLEGIREELADRPSYALTPEEMAQVQEEDRIAQEISDYEAELSYLGVSLDDSDEVIRAAIEKWEKENGIGVEDAPLDLKGSEYLQSDYDRGGRGARATINGDVVLEPLVLKGLAKIDSHRAARDAVELGQATNQSGDGVEVSKSSVKKWYSKNANELKRNLAPHLVDAFKQSVTYHQADGFHYAVGVISLDRQDISTRFIIEEVGGKENKLYQIEGVELTPISRGFPQEETLPSRARGSSTRGISVAQAVDVFNRMGENSYPLFQGRRMGGNRGSMQVMDDGRQIINLFQRADLSTLLHESGHFFLNIMQDMAGKGEASAQAELDAVRAWWRGNADGVVKDANKAIDGAGVEVADVEAWLDNGTTGVQAKDRAIDIGLQEQFARGFEAYLMEGKAPSEGLRAAFEKFRSWLIAIYRRVARLDVKLSDEIRGVFDRMIASDEAIAAVRGDLDGVGGVMANAASLGLTDEEYGALLKKREAAQDEAKARLLGETMQPLKRAKEEWFKRERAMVRGEVEQEINAQPRYRAFEFMANGRWLGNQYQAKDIEDFRLSKQQLIDRYGAGVLQTLPRGKRTVYAAKDGADIDMAAGLFGFKSGDEMVAALERMPPRKEAIEAETDRLMRERHGDALYDGTIEKEALEAVHNDHRGEWLAAELKALTEVAGVDVGLSAAQARDFAAKRIAGMQTAKAVKSNVFLAAERKAGNQAAKLGAQLARQALWQQAARRRLARKAKAGAQGEATIGAVNTQIEATNQSIKNYNETVAKLIKAKQSQLLNHMLFVESKKASEEVASALRRARRLNSLIAKMRSGRKRLGETEFSGEYIEPMEAILEDYEFRKVSKKRLDRRQALLTYIAKMTQEGRENELAIPDHVIEDARRVDYRNLSMEHLRGVVDSLKNIEHMARRWGKLLMSRRERGFDEAKQVIIDGLGKNLKQKNLEWIKKQGIKAGIRKFGRNYIALVQNATHILRRIDGRKDLGAVYELIKTPLDEASFNERRDRDKAAKDFKKLYSVYSADEQRQMAVMRKYDELGGRSFSKWNLIAMALNMGNEGNLARLSNDKAVQRLRAQDIAVVKRLLDKRDWDFVQSVWDYLETWKTKIAERDRRLRGIEPEWVEAKEVITPYGIYRGGYYPIKYDGELGGHRRMADEANEIFAQMTAGSYASATTKQGHLKARVGSGNQSLSLDIGVMGKHVMEVIHDLHFNEPVVNAWRLFNNNDVEAAFLKADLKETYETLKLWVQDVAAGQIMGDNDLARMVNKLRGGFTVSKIAYNVFTVVQQPLGLGQSAQIVGAKNLAAVMLEYGGRRSEMVKEVLAKSNIMWERKNTFNKDVMDAVAQSNIAGAKAGKVKGVIDDYIVPIGLYGLVAVQFYGVDVPTWIAAYRKGLNQFNGDEKRAVHYADMAISASQASGVFLDRSAIERGTLSSSIRQNPFVLLMTTLGSYFFAKQNRVIEATQELRSKPLSAQSIMKYAYSLTLLLAFEAVIVATIKQALQDNDDDDESWLWNVASGTIENYLGGMPLVRDMVGGAKGFDTGTYAALGNTFVRPFVRAGDGKFDRPFVKSIINVTGTLTSLPSTQTNRILDSFVRSMDGDEFSMMEMIFGRSRK